MKTRDAVLASALALALAVAMHGCTDNRASIQIDSICAPPDDCAFTGSCEAQYISWPTLDVTASLRDAMSLYLEVQNQLPNNGNPDLGRANTNDAHVDETVIEYEGVALPTTTVGSNLLVPADGVAVVKIEVIPDALQAGPTLQAFAPTIEPREIVARVRLRGYHDDATRFETGEFPITIRICSGCVTQLCGAGAQTCPPDSNGQLPIACPP